MPCHELGRGRLAKEVESKGGLSLVDILEGECWKRREERRGLCTGWALRQCSRQVQHAGLGRSRGQGSSSYRQTDSDRRLRMWVGLDSHCSLPSMRPLFVVAHDHPTGPGR